jgi:hypothetical protein
LSHEGCSPPGQSSASSREANQGRALDLQQSARALRAGEVDVDRIDVLVITRVERPGLSRRKAYSEFCDIAHVRPGRYLRVLIYGSEEWSPVSPIVPSIDVQPAIGVHSHATRPKKKWRRQGMPLDTSGCQPPKFPSGLVLYRVVDRFRSDRVGTELIAQCFILSLRQAPSNDQRELREFLRSFLLLPFSPSTDWVPLPK